MKLFKKKHESPDTLYAYSEGMLEPHEVGRVEEHLARCPACAEQVREFRALQTLVDAPVPDPPPLRAIIAGALQRNEIHRIPSKRRRSGGKEHEMSREAVMQVTGRTQSPRAFWRIAVPLAAALGLGALAGLWVTQGKDSSAADTAYVHYERARQAYEAGRREEAVQLVERGLQGRLQLSGDLSEMERDHKKLALLRELGRNNRDYALDLANNGRKAEAQKVNGLTRGVANQLLDQDRIVFGLVGVALHQLAGTTQVKLLESAGDGVAAQAAEAEYQARLARYRSEVRPKIQAFTRDTPENSGPYARWKVAWDEERLMREIEKVWRTE
ncbi:MAG: zf-HC2 domain-containing protein [Armatimonadetes bacterium]|nr:zf-HC2 domain-containing protein [Armatimonadota bacterium]